MRYWLFSDVSTSPGPGPMTMETSAGEPPTSALTATRMVKVAGSIVNCLRTLRPPASRYSKETW